MSIPRWKLPLPIVLMATSLFAWSPGLVMGQAQSPANGQKPAFGMGVRSVAFSPDGRFLAAGLGEPNERGRAILWDRAGKKILWTHEENMGIPGVAFSPDGKHLAIAVYNQTAKLLNAATGQVERTFRGHAKEVRAVAFSPDGRSLVTGSWDHTVKVWDVATGKELRTLAGPSDRLYSVAFSSSGRWLLAVGGTVMVWNAADGQIKRDIRHYFMPTAVFAGDRWIMTGSFDGTVRIWDLESGKERLRFHNMGGVDRLAFSPRNRLLATTHSFDKAIALFDFTLEAPTTQYQERFKALLVQMDHDDYAVREAAGKEVLALGFAVEPLLRRAMTESPSAEVRIRCRRLREEMLSKPTAFLEGHTARVESLAVSPDEKVLASGSGDGTVRLWNLKERRETARLTAEVK
jgi:WD40 repeat protein